MSNERLIVFVKAPQPGPVKTRIAETAGQTRACAIYREITETVLTGIASVSPVELRFSPDDGIAQIEPWLRKKWAAQPQGAGDLGQRLQNAFAAAFADGAERVAIIGSDCPEVKAADVRTTWDELKTHDLVVGPAIVGGYWLIGLRKPQPELFQGITWSSDKVLGETLERARLLGLRIQLLRILSNIDTESDWNAHVGQRDSS